jgi:hypothetical protein
MRASARRSHENAVRRANGETGLSYAGELSESRVEALNEIDPGWAPQGWDVAWQRSYRLLLAHVQAGGVVPAVPGEVVVQGEDLAAWVAAQRAGWDGLVAAQQWLLESVGVEPLGEGEAAVPTRRTQADRWATHLAAARQFHAREGHLRVPRKHVEELAGEVGEGSTAVRLGGWLDNTRRRADKLAAERRAELDELGMRW